MSQLYALGTLKSFEEIRDLIKRSFQFQTYEPENPELWKEAFRKLRGK